MNEDRLRVFSKRNIRIMFIQYREMKEIPQEWIEAVQNGDENIIKKLQRREVILNCATSYYLKNGKPVSSIKRMLGYRLNGVDVK